MYEFQKSKHNWYMALFYFKTIVFFLCRNSACGKSSVTLHSHDKSVSLYNFRIPYIHYFFQGCTLIASNATDVGRWTFIKKIKMVCITLMVTSVWLMVFMYLIGWDIVICKYCPQSLLPFWTKLEPYISKITNSTVTRVQICLYEWLRNVWKNYEELSPFEKEWTIGLYR